MSAQQLKYSGVLQALQPLGPSDSLALLQQQQAIKSDKPQWGASRLYQGMPQAQEHPPPVQGLPNRLQHGTSDSTDSWLAPDPKDSLDLNR